MRRSRIETLAERRRNAWAGKQHEDVAALADELDDAYARKHERTARTRDDQPYRGKTTPWDRWRAKL